MTLTNILCYPQQAPSTAPEFMLINLCKAPKDGSWLPREPTSGLGRWNFQPHPSSTSSEEGRGAGDRPQSPLANDLINHVCVMEPP